MKKYPALLWSIAVMFSVEARSTTLSPPNPDINNSSTTTQLMRKAETAISQITPAHHNKTELQTPTGHPEHTSFTPSNNTIAPQKPAETRAPTITTPAPEHSVSHSGKSEEATSRTQSPSPDPRGSTAEGGIRSTSAGTVTSSGAHPTLPTVTGAAQASHAANVSETEKPVEHTTGHQTTTISSAVSTATPATGLFTPSQGGSTFTPAITPAPSSTGHNSTPSQSSFTQELGSTAASTATTNATSKPPSAFDSNTTLGLTTRHQLSTAFTQHQSTKNASIAPSDASNTTTPGSTPELTATTEAASNTSESIPTTATSNSSSGGVLIPKVPTKSPLSTVKTASTTTKVPHKESSRDSVVSKCLIAIAVLAGLATIFMVSTIILCTKLSSRKYRCRRDSQEGTEMVCISALMPERNFSYAPHYNPVSNGFLLPNAEGDSDEDGGDNLTLRSFLPESDHV